MLNRFYPDYDDLFTKLRDLVTPKRKIFMVGGAIRDIFLNRPTNDFDFVLSSDSVLVARSIANQLNGDFYIMDKERGTARVITERNNKRFSLDFSLFQGETIAQDLKSRDFTINAIALDISNPGEAIDPMEGREDILQKKLRMCSPTSFPDDPIRVLRAIRLSVGLGFSIPADTVQAMKASTNFITRSSAERQRDELFHIMDLRKTDSALRLMDHIGAIKVVLPELELLRNLPQSAPHIHRVWEHTLAVIAWLDKLFQVLVDGYNEEASASLLIGLAVLKLGQYRHNLFLHYQTDPINDRSYRALLKFIALYHDVGKANTYHEDENGRIRFLQHEQIGSEVIKRRGRLLALSENEITLGEVIVRNHMRIHNLDWNGTKPTRRAIYHFFRDTNSAGVDVCLLSLADVQGTYGSTLTQEHWIEKLNICQTLFSAWWEERSSIVTPPRLITGDDLIQLFGLKPGRQIGEILESVQESQAIGTITDREEAINFVKDLLQNE